jgi:hypothetical protein
MSTEALAMDYHVVVQGFEGLSRESFYEIAIDLDNPYILLPGWGYDSRKPAGQDLANVLNSFGEEFEVLRAFSGSRVLVNNSESVPSGDPKFAIGYVKPAALDAERNKIRIELDLASLEGRKKVSADGTLFLPWNSSLQSAPLQLKKGKYEVAIVTKGTEVKGTNALFEVYLGQGNLIGQFYSQKTFQEVRIPFEVAVDGEETLKVRFANDAATKNAAGEKTEDRNAYIKSIMIFQTE